MASLLGAKVKITNFPSLILANDYNGSIGVITKVGRKRFYIFIEPKPGQVTSFGDPWKGSTFALPATAFEVTL